MAIGRPTTYNPQIAAEICEAIACGTDGLRDICAAEGMPAVSTVFLWLAKHASFSEQYAHAKAAQAHLLVTDCREIADDGRNDWMERHGKDAVGWQLNGEHVQRSKLRVEQRRWEAERLLPKVYGQRQMVEHSGSITLVDVSDEELLAEIAGLVATGRLQLPHGVQLAEDENAEDADDYSDIA